MQELVARSKRQTRSLGTFEVVKSEGFGGRRIEPVGTIEVTDVSIKGMEAREYDFLVTGNTDDEFWFCGLRRVGSLGEVLGTYRARINSGFSWGSGDLAFASSEELDKFVAATNSAMEAWDEEFGEVREVRRSGSFSCP